MYLECIELTNKILNEGEWNCIRAEKDHHGEMSMQSYICCLKFHVYVTQPPSRTWTIISSMAMPTASPYEFKTCILAYTCIQSLVLVSQLPKTISRLPDGFRKLIRFWCLRICGRYRFVQCLGWDVGSRKFLELGSLEEGISMFWSDGTRFNKCTDFTRVHVYLHRWFRQYFKMLLM